MKLVEERWVAKHFHRSRQEVKWFRPADQSSLRWNLCPKRDMYDRQVSCGTVNEISGRAG
jgi:hypothetical protein